MALSWWANWKGLFISRFFFFWFLRICTPLGKVYKAGTNHAPLGMGMKGKPTITPWTVYEGGNQSCPLAWDCVWRGSQPCPLGTVYGGETKPAPLGLSMKGKPTQPPWDCVRSGNKPYPPGTGYKGETSQMQLMQLKQKENLHTQKIYQCVIGDNKGLADFKMDIVQQTKGPHGKQKSVPVIMSDQQKLTYFSSTVPTL